MHFRIGQGFDLHQFAPDRDFILGGVRIDHNKGLLGHSDADALCHAIIVALRRALAMVDSGNQFPDTVLKYFGCDSTELLAKILYEVVKDGYKIKNIDATIKTQ